MKWVFNAENPVTKIAFFGPRLEHVAGITPRAHPTSQTSQTDDSTYIPRPLGKLAPTKDSGPPSFALAESDSRKDSFLFCTHQNKRHGSHHLETIISTTQERPILRSPRFLLAQQKGQKNGPPYGPFSRFEISGVDSTTFPNWEAGLQLQACKKNPLGRRSVVKGVFVWFW